MPNEFTLGSDDGDPLFHMLLLEKRKQVDLSAAKNTWPVWRLVHNLNMQRRLFLGYVAVKRDDKKKDKASTPSSRVLFFSSYLIITSTRYDSSVVLGRRQIVCDACQWEQCSNQQRYGSRRTLLRRDRGWSLCDSQYCKPCNYIPHHTLSYLHWWLGVRRTWLVSEKKKKGKKGEVEKKRTSSPRMSVLCGATWRWGRTGQLTPSNGLSAVKQFLIVYEHLKLALLGTLKVERKTVLNSMICKILSCIYTRLQNSLFFARLSTAACAVASYRLSCSSSSHTNKSAWTIANIGSYIDLLWSLYIQCL